MAKIIIFKNENNGVSVCSPSGEISIEEVMAKDVPSGAGARIIEFDDLPNGYRDFFNAWEMDDTSITVNFAKAKEITKNRLRAERKPLFAIQDVLFQRALESNSDTTSIVAEKARLRNITNLVETANTLEELRNITI
jgi:hypothetical protein